MLRKYCSVLILLLIAWPVVAQQTQSYLDKNAAWKKGIELFNEKNYLSARQKFEDIYKQSLPANGHPNETLMQNVEYYIAVCAVEDGDNDAELLLLNYYHKYHETDKRRLVNFYLGKYYYDNKRYSDAIEYFTKVDISDLDNEQIYEYRFRLGYSYFVRKKFTEAKPLFLSIKEIKDKYYYPANYYYAFICFYTKDYKDALKTFLAIEDSKMYAAVVPYYVAQIYFLQKDYDKLIPYLNKSLDRSDILYKDEMKFLLGKAYFEKGDYANALPLLEPYISKQSKTSKEDIYELAYSEYKTGDYSKAADNFKQLYGLDEKLGQNAAYALADCYLQMKMKPEARAAFQNAAAKNYDETIQQNALFNYGKLSFELGYSSEAIQSLQQYHDKYPSGIYADEVNELLAAVLVQTRNYEKAYHIMENMTISSPLLKEAYQKVTYFRAVELYNDKKLDEALALCDKSLKNPLNPDLQALATYLRAEIQYANGDYPTALQGYLVFAQECTRELERKGEASKFRAYYNAAYCYFKEKNYSDATIYFNNAIDESQNTVDTRGKNILLPDLYQRYGDCAFVTKNYGKALEAYTTIVNKKWSAADYAQFRKGIILGLQNRNADKIEAMHYLITTFPSSNYLDQAYYEIGETYLSDNNSSAARAAYQDVINKFPNSNLLPRCYVKLAVIDYNSGKKEQAAADYEAVVIKYPESRDAKESLDALKDLYVEIGKPDAYVDFAKAHGGVSISTSEEDSLTYLSADDAYNTSGCTNSVPLYGNYVSKFPNGLFSNEAHWRRAECLLTAKDYVQALPDLEAIIRNRYSKYYEMALLKASGIAYYELKDYAKAADFYKQLYIASTSTQNTYTAMTGLFYSAVQLNHPDEIIEYADQLLNSGTAKEEDAQEAYYQKAKAYYNKGNKDFAMAAFNHVTELPVSEKAVEAKYMVAKILFEENNYQQSLDTCFKLKNKYGSYEYWVAKTFILMADNYYALGNSFQAKATLESIVQNYTGDQAVLEEAKTKLEKMRTEELNKSKLLPPQSPDSLMMEQDSVIKN